MEIELTEFKRGESSSGAAEGDESSSATYGRGESSSAATERGESSSAAYERGESSSAGAERGESSSLTYEFGESSSATAERGESSAAAYERGESSSAAAERGESSAAADERGESSSESEGESNYQIDGKRLHILKKISEGANSCVHHGFLMFNMDEFFPVAVKRIQREKGTNVSPERKEKFQREVRMHSKVQHECIVMFLGATMEPALTIVTELMGGSLKSYLESIRPCTLDLKDALTLALGISRGMEHLHANGIIHRNLKPSNIYITDDGRSLKVGDFGLSREETEGDLTAEVGTRPWMAPELFRFQILFHRLYNTVELPEKFIDWKPRYDHKVDVYSFAFVLWEMITNKTPYPDLDDMLKAFAVSAFTTQLVRPDLEVIPGRIPDLLSSCWAFQPRKRPEFKQISQTLEELIRDEELNRNVELICSTLPSRGGTEPSSPVSIRERKKSRSWQGKTVKKVRDAFKKLWPRNP